MNILGIETSCDETAAAVVKDGCYVLSNTLATSLKEHERFGGIIPEIASRRQLESIHPVVESALDKANVSLNDIDAIAVTAFPGLIGSLLVGLSFARALSAATGKPLIEVDHIKAHLYANFLRIKDKNADSSLPEFPAVGLIVSGGHTALYHLKDFQDFKLIGQTRDDAAGEAFDKVARILQLGYPGGPVIDRIAKSVSATSIRFPKANLPGGFDFSFSGLKTAVLYYDREHRLDQNYSVAEVAFAFQESAVQALAHKAFSACEELRCKTLLVGGGVAANSRLREELKEKSQRNGVQVYFPPMEFCVDNAAMIAGFGYRSLN